MKTQTLPPLPFAPDALAPVMSRETLEFHYGKHHKGYVEKLNQLLPGTPWENESLEEIVRGSFQKDSKIFNQAAQVWNHTFFWSSLSPVSERGGKLESQELKEALNRSFGGFEKFKQVFTKEAAALFGSGWTWLIAEPGGELRIESTPNADNPLRKGRLALLTLDVWEHAYYIDYRNARPQFLDKIWSIFNWDFAAQNYAQRSKSAAA